MDKTPWVVFFFFLLLLLHCEIPITSSSRSVTFHGWIKWWYREGLVSFLVIHFSGADSQVLASGVTIIVIQIRPHDCCDGVELPSHDPFGLDGVFHGFLNTRKRKLIKPRYQTNADNHVGHDEEEETTSPNRSKRLLRWLRQTTFYVGKKWLEKWSWMHRDSRNRNGTLEEDWRKLNWMSQEGRI